MYFLSRTNLFPNPSNCFSNLVINPWLFVDGTAEASAGNSNESPPAVVVDDERTSTVSKAGVHLASLVSSTEHLLVQLN